MAATSWELVEAHRTPLACYLRDKCRDAADVEDCVQEALLRAAQMPQLDPDRVFGLLKTISYRLAMDTHRERHRRARALARLGVPAPLSADDLALDRQQARELAQRAAELSLRQRQALSGRADGFAPSETAAFHGVPAKTMHLALSRARVALKAAAGSVGLVLWLRKRWGLSARGGAATAAAVMLASVTLLIGQDHGHVQVAPSALLPLQGASLARPQRAAPPPEHPSPAPRAIASKPPVPSNAASLALVRPTTLVKIASPVPQAVQVGIGVTLSNQNEPLLSSIQACLQPGALSLDPTHAGCSR
jgi:DNA-directed RNA polymerase specialized sigma24 family protein